MMRPESFYNDQEALWYRGIYAVVASRLVPGPEGYNNDDIMENIKSYSL